MLNLQNIGRYFLSCDWGTTSFRLNLSEVKSGSVIRNITNSKGIKKIYKRWTEHGETSNRVDFYLSFLREQIADLETKSQRDLRHMPILVSGMASSSIGIKELPYQTLPIKLNSPDFYIEKIEPSKEFPHPLYLISGIRSRNDVMRGEETQLLGLTSKFGITSGLYLLTGTHSKHVVIKNGSITDFKTYMTGEIFDLLSSQSILSGSIVPGDNYTPGRSFEKGVKASRKENFLHLLFKIRARDILETSGRMANYDFLNGLLIGTELKAFWDHPPDSITLSGKPRVQHYYAAALEMMQVNYHITEWEPAEDAASRGHHILLTK